jgi:hypothetical protein
MISAVKILTPIVSARSRASCVMRTSNARMDAYSGARSSITPAFITSFLWMGPMPTAATGILCPPRKL